MNKLKAEDVQWVVNSLAELGVKIGDQFFFLYKGDSLVYGEASIECHQMTYRTVGKREFGECCHPINYSDPTKIGTVHPNDSDRWKPLPSAPEVEGSQVNQVPASDATLRDYLAGQYLIGRGPIDASTEHERLMLWDQLTEDAYACADAMIKARSK